MNAKRKKRIRTIMYTYRMPYLEAVAAEHLEHFASNESFSSEGSLNRWARFAKKGQEDE